MAETTKLDLLGILDESRLRSFQFSVIAICFGIVALDGFDTQSIAFVAPALRESWQVSPALFGPLFGAGLFGTLIGSIVLGSLADRFGRKPMVAVSTLLFGVMTLMCATATSIEQLGLYRFVAGLGLGGAIPNVLALISEYSPKRVRATVIVITFAGFPIGAVLGGMASARIIPAFGWESVFIVGGVLPVLLLPIILLWIPESARYLSMQPDRHGKLSEVLARIDPDLASVDLDQINMPPARSKSIPVRNLFAGGRAAWTMLLWLLTFTTLLLGYFLVNWTPLLLVDAGLDHHQAIMGVVALNLGGIIGGIIIGRISDKRGPFMAIGTAFFVGAIFVGTVGLMIQSTATVLLGLIFVVGLCVFGAQLNLSAVSATYYPIYMRSTGIGWNMGIGRFGSVVGPTIGGALIAYGLARGQMFLSATIPAVIAGLTVIFMSFNVPAVDEDDPGPSESSSKPSATH
jgi:AAHS family 4-hydroxybenzoate transporter-like MFS transporter